MLKPSDKQYINSSKSHVLPHIGQRIIKTAIAVYLCFLISSLRLLIGQDMTSEAAITAIVCMQPFIKSAKKYAINRFIGTFIGSLWGLLFLLLISVFPFLGLNSFVLYALMSVGVLLSLYTSVLFRQPESSSLAAVVFICIVIAFPNIENPLIQAGNRFIDVLIGTLIAIVVNVIRFPRDKNPNLVFFIRTKDLISDRFSQIQPSAMYHLNKLFNDGAKICLVSEHAPAFIISQMSLVKVNTPLIVMDGAAIYDINENKYLYTQALPLAVSTELQAILEQYKFGYFIYTIHNNKTCIFHRGELSRSESELFEVMKRSPYRSYLDAETFSSHEIVYFKIINTERQLIDILEELSQNHLSVFKHLRAVIRPQGLSSGQSALYLYSNLASIKSAQEYLMDLLKESVPELTPQEILLRAPYNSERDALHLLQKVEKAYEPIKLPWHKSKEKHNNR